MQVLFSSHGREDQGSNRLHADYMEVIIQIAYACYLFSAFLVDVNIVKIISLENICNLCIVLQNLLFGLKIPVSNGNPILRGKKLSISLRSITR